jgi:hypothetical protein
MPAADEDAAAVLARLRGQPGAPAAPPGAPPATAAGAPPAPAALPVTTASPGTRPGAPIAAPRIPGMNASLMDSLPPRQRALVAASLLQMNPDQQGQALLKLASTPGVKPEFHETGNGVFAVLPDGQSVYFGPPTRAPATQTMLDAAGNRIQAQYDPARNIWFKIGDAPPPDANLPLTPERQAQELQQRQSTFEPTWAKETEGPAAKQFQAAVDGTRSAAQTVQTLQQWDALSRNYKTGPLAQRLNTVAAFANEAGIDLSGLHIANLSPNDAATGQALTKVSTAYVRSLIRQAGDQTPGGFPAAHFSNVDLNFLESGAPNIKNQELANQLVSALAQEQARREIDFGQAAASANVHSADDWRKFETTWVARNVDNPIIRNNVKPDDVANLPRGVIYKLAGSDQWVLRPRLPAAAGGAP